MIFHGILQQRLNRCRPYRAKELGQARFYTDAVPTGLKSECLAYSKNTSILSKIDTHGAVRNARRIWVSTPQNRTYRPNSRWLMADGYLEWKFYCLSLFR